MGDRLEYWLRRRPGEAVPMRRLVCLPHAGGSAGVFLSWAALLPAGIELVAVQYPGRQDRLGEPFVTSMSELSGRLAREIGALGDLPTALFGHSMGSAVGYEVAAWLERERGMVMEHVFVSGRTAPHRRRGEDNARLTDDALITAVAALGGADSEIFNIPNLRPLILPPLRADLTLLDRYRPDTVQPLHAPITALGGVGDRTCPIADLDAWRDATAADFKVRTFPGGHHYISTNEAAVVGAIVTELRARSTGR